MTGVYKQYLPSTWKLPARSRTVLQLTLLFPPALGDAARCCPRLVYRTGEELISDIDSDETVAWSRTRRFTLVSLVS